MKVLVTGVAGQLGYDVIKVLNAQGIECLGIDRGELDITDQQAVNAFIDEYKPTVLVHCAAYTAVDLAEDNKEICYKINVLGTQYLAEACKKNNTKMVYISTDYVFEGIGDDFYLEDSTPNPINYYGQSKYDGEVVVKDILDKYFIIRISWVYGLNGNNFVKTMIRLGKERDSLSVVSDQIGSPTNTYDLSKLIVDMIQTDKYGVYHATNEGVCSWYDFAKAALDYANVEVELSPITSDQYPTKARRPFNSRMSKEKLTKSGFKPLPNWKDSLKLYVEELMKNDN